MSNARKRRAGRREERPTSIAIADGCLAPRGAVRGRTSQVQFRKFQVKAPLAWQPGWIEAPPGWKPGSPSAVPAERETSQAEPRAEDWSIKDETQAQAKAPPFAPEPRSIKTPPTPAPLQQPPS